MLFIRETHLNLSTLVSTEHLARVIKSPYAFGGQLCQYEYVAGLDLPRHVPLYEHVYKVGFSTPVGRMNLLPLLVYNVVLSIHHR